MKTICVRVTMKFDHRLRVMAAESDMSRSEFVRWALEEKLEQLEAGSTTWQVTEVTAIPHNRDASSGRVTNEGVLNRN